MPPAMRQAMTDEGRRGMDLATPAGFRDVLPDEATARERIARAVQDAFAARGYAPIETPTL